MAVNKVIDTTSFSIEVEAGSDQSGNPTYRKKNFNNIKIDAVPEAVYEVAEAIKAVLSAPTRDSFLNETSKLLNA
jgi:hypothetical protein